MGKEKKEIGMEKLIELLNEYEEYKEKETEIRNYTRRCVECEGAKRIECLREVDGELFGEDEGTAIIICKGYMFIEWLVENDKIDHGKLSNYIIDNKFFGDKIAELKEYESLLMLLSISDTPIEDLISYLK